jgi:hypothetical protein
MQHMYYFVVSGLVGEALALVVLRVPRVLLVLVVVVTGHNSIYFLFRRVFFCFLFPT